MYNFTLCHLINLKKGNLTVMKSLKMTECPFYAVITEVDTIYTNVILSLSFFTPMSSFYCIESLPLWQPRYCYEVESGQGWTKIMQDNQNGEGAVVPRRSGFQASTTAK